MKFFSQSQVNWNRWQPQDLTFKSNSVTKKLVPEGNLLSYSSKQDRDAKMCRILGGKGETKQHWNGQSYQQWSRDVYRSIQVKLKDLKTDFPTADIDFIDHIPKTNSVGNSISSVDVLVYIQSFHQQFSWTRNSQGHYYSQKTGKIAPINEGYRVSYGGQGDANNMSFEDLEEIAQISRAIKNFLVEVVVAYKNGSLMQDISSLTEQELLTECVS
jgi:hypothetical protein